MRVVHRLLYIYILRGVMSAVNAYPSINTIIAISSHNLQNV